MRCSKFRWIESTTALRSRSGTVLSDPEIKRTFLEMGANVEFLGPDALGKQISAELKSWPELARSIGIRPGSS